METLTLKKSFVLKAPIARVWDALTDPEQIKQYFFGTQTETDWQPGSPIYFRGEWNGVKYEDKGTILAMEPEKLIRYSYWSSMSGKEDKPENYQTVTYAVTVVPEGTALTVIQEDIENQEKLDHSEGGWIAFADGIKKLVE